MWRQRWERWLNRSWYGGTPWTLLLLPLSWVVGWVVARRRHAFLASPPPTAGLPVIVVGGVTVGGTGKSPVLMALARHLMDAGFRVAVVSRGYGAVYHDRPRQIDAQCDSAREVGDEPLLMARQLAVPVVVCRQRAAAVAWIAERELADVVLSDDGLQHYAMARDYEIAVIDGQRRLGNGHLLPAGPLREPADRLRCVDWVLVRNGPEPDRGFRYHVDGLRQLASGERRGVADQVATWRDNRVLAMTGLGQPAQFFSLLRELGFRCESLALADHAPPSVEQLARADIEIILVTEKDAVKLTPPIDPRIWVIEITATLPGALVASVLARLETAQ